jgi:hypothetical protein
MTRELAPNHLRSDVDQVCTLVLVRDDGLVAALVEVDAEHARTRRMLRAACATGERVERGEPAVAVAHAVVGTREPLAVAAERECGRRRRRRLDDQRASDRPVPQERFLRAERDARSMGRDGDGSRIDLG